MADEGTGAGKDDFNGCAYAGGLLLSLVPGGFATFILIIARASTGNGAPASSACSAASAATAERSFSGRRARYGAR